MLKYIETSRAAIKGLEGPSVHKVAQLLIYYVFRRLMFVNNNDNKLITIIIIHLALVRVLRGIFMRECANLYKSMKIGTLLIFHMLCPNPPGAKANSQWCRHIREFKMAAA